MKNKWRILKIIVTVITFGFLLSFSLKRFSNKKMENISVNFIKTNQPVYFIDEKEIKNLVKNENPSHKIGDINIPLLEKKLNKSAFIDSANVYLNLNGNLNLDIKQRVPAFRLNNNGKDFYVDEKGKEFQLSKNYSFPCMLVTGNIEKEEYPALINLVKKIDQDAFSKKYFIGVSKEKGGYQLLTSEGNYKVEIGDLDQINFKVYGFKTFVEKILVNENPEKYNKISVKYDNQIVTTLNPNFEENDSVLAIVNKEFAKIPTKTIKKEEKPSSTISKKTEKPEIKKTAAKPTAKKEIKTAKVIPKKTTEPKKTR